LVKLTENISDDAFIVISKKLAKCMLLIL